MLKFAFKKSLDITGKKKNDQIYTLVDKKIPETCQKNTLVSEILDKNYQISIEVV